jgi:hypothetical protein
LASLDLGGKNSLITDFVSLHGPEPPCVGKQVRPGDDLDAIINADLDAIPTNFCVQAGTYGIDNTIGVADGDELLGEPGTLE